jgi:hypothetical protein
MVASFSLAAVAMARDYLLAVIVCQFQMHSLRELRTAREVTCRKIGFTLIIRPAGANRKPKRLRRPVHNNYVPFIEISS